MESGRRYLVGTDQGAVAVECVLDFESDGWESNDGGESSGSEDDEDEEEFEDEVAVELEGEDELQ